MCTENLSVPLFGPSCMFENCLEEQEPWYGMVSSVLKIVNETSR